MKVRVLNTKKPFKYWPEVIWFGFQYINQK
jgi:hypothetical protein